MYMRILFFAVGMTVATAVSASQGPSVDYSADFSMETADVAMQGKMYYSPGKERREYKQDGDNSIMIVRHDKNVVWMLMSEDSVYMEMSIPKAGRSDDLGAFNMKMTPMGNEVMNGVKTTKSKVIMSAANGAKMGGFIWTSKEGIAVKLDAIGVEKGSKERFKIELTNLKIGKQNPTLFEIPAGYTKMGMGILGGMMGGGHDNKQPQDKKTQHKKKGSGIGLKDALDVFK